MIQEVVAERQTKVEALWGVGVDFHSTSSDNLKLASQFSWTPVMDLTANRDTVSLLLSLWHWVWFIPSASRDFSSWRDEHTLWPLFSPHSHWSKYWIHFSPDADDPPNDPTLKRHSSDPHRGKCNWFLHWQTNIIKLHHYHHILPVMRHLLYIITLCSLSGSKKNLLKADVISLLPWPGATQSQTITF